MATGTERQIVTYDDFRGGEAGTLHGTRAAPPRSFTGKNVLVYRDGTIGPRNGLYDATPTGQSNGKISAFGYTGGSNGTELWYVQGTSVYQFSPEGARSSAYTGSVASHTLVCDQAPAGPNKDYLMVPGDKVYLLDHNARTCTALTGSPQPGRCIAAFGSRLYIGATGQNNRVRYSADANPNDWTIDADPGHPGSFDVGENPNRIVRGLYPLRDSLVIVLDDGQVWVLTANGDPVETGTLRRVAGYESGGAIWQPGRGHVAYGWELWSVGMHSTAPQVFNGGRMRALEFLGTEHTAGAIPPGAWSTSILQTDVLPPEYATMSVDDTLVFVGNNRGLVRRNDIWTKHEFEQTVVGYAVDGRQGAVALTDGGGASAAPKFWWWHLAAERPPIKGGGRRGAVGDGSDTAHAAEFTLPEWSDPKGRRVQVRAVIVDFTKFDVGVTDATNNFTVQVISEFGLDGTGDVANTAMSWTEDTDEATSAGLRDSKRFTFASALANSFQIKVSAIRGVRIDRIRVIVDISERPLV